MKYLIAFMTLILAGVAGADSLQQRVDALDAAPNVLEAWIDTAPVSIGRAGTVYAGRVAWVESSGSTATQRGVDVIVINLGMVGQEAAFWLNAIPEPLKPAEPDAYITGRTQPFTKAQVESFCNTQWKATSGNAAARDVIQFTVENVSGNTVRVSGLFHDVATGNRVKHTYLISLVDANGATTGANVKFEKVIE